MKLSDRQLEALALLIERPRETTDGGAGGYLSGMTAKALRARGLARRMNGLYEITDAGRAACNEAMGHE